MRMTSWWLSSMASKPPSSAIVKAVTGSSWCRKMILSKCWSLTQNGWRYLGGWWRLGGWFSISPSPHPSPTRGEGVSTSQFYSALKRGFFGPPPSPLVGEGWGEGDARELLLLSLKQMLRLDQLLNRCS